jgi:hypothetical protein
MHTNISSDFQRNMYNSPLLGHSHKDFSMFNKKMNDSLPVSCNFDSKFRGCCCWDRLNPPANGGFPDEVSLEQLPTDPARQVCEAAPPPPFV